jgi:hypothetical protein
VGEIKTTVDRKFLARPTEVVYEMPPLFVLLLVITNVNALHTIVRERLDDFPARELARYIYLTTGEYPSIVDNLSKSKTRDIGTTVIIGAPHSKLISSLGSRISDDINNIWSKTMLNIGRHSIHRTSSSLVVIVGDHPKGRLYGVYTAAEQLGVMFGLHQDILPDPTAGLPLRDKKSLPFIDVPPTAPMFDYRGLQPFHDFLEGPDAWDTSMYKHIISQLSHMKANFIGLHTYPYNITKPGQLTGHNEPTVWVGTTDQLNDDGTVKDSYPTSYANSMRGEWSEAAMPTSSYSFGTSNIFEDDCWPNFLGKDSCPYPTTQAASNALFEATSTMLESAFAFGTQLYVDSCVGTETPLSKPNYNSKNKTLPSTQSYYEGIFTRLTKVLPSLDWYWIWTPEEWEWSKVTAKDPVFTDALDDLAAAMAAKKNVVGFQNMKMATNGWVVGPLPDRTVFDKLLPDDWDAITSIDLNTGHNPVDPSYLNVTKHKKWVIPWM